jgi:hypothetical protein
MAQVVVPVMEPAPSLPEPRKPKPKPVNFKAEQMFAFDTETTRCGKKELRSCQFSFYEDGLLHNIVYAVEGWFDDHDTGRIETLCGEPHETVSETFETVDSLRVACQQLYEHLLYGTQTAKRKKVKRCAVAFNANFDLGVLADKTTLGEMRVGGMEGAGCRYEFLSGRTATSGLNINTLFLGAFSVPFAPKRGLIWDIQALSRNLWGAANLASVGRVLGMKKLVDEGERSFTYGVMDSVITLKAAIKLTAELEEMGFTGAADRFISGATVAKDLMKQHYQPFYLTQEQHEFVWPAYFGGMTGCLDIDALREPVEDMIYGDLDGAYNASGQKLNVFQWSAVNWLPSSTVKSIIDTVKKQPETYWTFGSLHIEVEGDFDNLPIRVGKCGEGGTPSQSEGLVWARMRNYRTTLSLGDYLHSRPKKHRILRGLMVNEYDRTNPCLFKMTADERKKYPKKDTDGEWIRENFTPNTWWKLAGNTLYGSFANRNGKKRETAGKWFNALIASSITGAIRHAMWTVNEASGAIYNDTDSALCTVEGFEKAVEALKPLDIGFSNKTSDELGTHDLAAIAVVQGSKRYALVAHDGTFGAKCHGLGSWFVMWDGRVQSVAHNEEVLEAVWRFNYPDVFGDPNPEIMGLKVFHKFSIKTLKVATMVQEYARRQWDIPLTEITKYGKAGNFGFLSPSIAEGQNKVVVLVGYESQEAVDNSDLTLAEIAYGWGRAYDKKYDYENLCRWTFEGEDIKQVKSVEHSQNLRQEGFLSDSDISVHVNHDSDGA